MAGSTPWFARRLHSRRMRALLALAVGCSALVGIAPLVTGAHADPGDATQRVSVGVGELEANYGAFEASISADGQVVAFGSHADNLVADDMNGSADIFVRDRNADGAPRVSVSATGEEAESDSFRPSISGDGRYIAFTSEATNLVALDSDDGTDEVFVHDRVTGATERVAVSSSGVKATTHSFYPSLSADGRFVAFSSRASNLVPGDTNLKQDVFVRDRVTGLTERVSVSSTGAQATGGGYDNDALHPSISADGRYVAFASPATNLVPGDTNGGWDTFVRDRVAGTTERVSVDSGGVQVCGCSDRNASISADGRYVAFDSQASNSEGADMLPGDGSREDVFVHDRVTGATKRVSVPYEGGESDHAYGSWDPSISADGRYIAFASYASNLLPDEVNEVIDVFVHDQVENSTARVSLSSDGTHGNGSSLDPRISADGSTVAFVSAASNLVDGDSNGTWDVFVRELSTVTFTGGLALLGHRRNGGYASDPVNTATGNFTETLVDLDFPVFGLDWSRTYNSLDSASGTFGPGWAASFSARVSESPSGAVTFTDWDGRVVSFPAEGAGWGRPEEVFGELVREVDETLALRFFSGDEWDFDVEGRLKAKTSWDGQTVLFAHDGSGRLVSATSSTGYSLTFTHDLEGRVEQVTSSDGRAVSYTYGTNGALATVTDPADGVTTIETDEAGRITEITDPDGKLVIANTYDADGRVTDQTTSSGDTVTFAYDAASRTTTVTHAGTGAGAVYGHDDYGRLTSITDAHGAVVSKEYDAAGNLIAVVDRRNAATSQTFDNHGNLLTRTGPGGVTETFTYDSSDRLSTHTNGENEATTFAYDGAERVPSTITDGAGGITVFDVGADGLVVAETDADGVTRTYDYDTSRNLVSATDEAGETTAYTYDAAGNQTSATTPLGHETSWTFDEMRRVLSHTDALGEVTTSQWTAAGRLESSTDETDATTTLAYDNAGRISTVTDPLGALTTFGYDTDGNLTSVTRPGNATWSMTYDELGRRLSETDPTGVTTTYGHDADGNLTATTDENDETTTWTYDLRGRVTARTDPLGHTTTFGYDLADRLTTMTDPAGTTSWSYDGAGRLVEETDARLEEWTWSYTPAGRLASATDPNLHSVTHDYDLLGRLETTTDAEAGVTEYGFDADGRLTTITSPAGLTTSYGYDALDRPTSVTDPAGVAETRSYTARGEIASVADGTGDTALFEYDPAGRLTQATDRNGGITSFGYDPRGNLVARTDPNGGVEHWSWDLADRLLTSSDQLDRTTTMSYDPLGRLSSVTDGSGRSTTVGYDDAGQLTSRAYGDGSTVAYGYDPAGRRTSMVDPGGTTTYAYDPTGNLTSVTTPDGKTLISAYDPGGRRTSLTYPDGQAATYGYDDANRLVSVAHPEAGTTAYSRDADGRVLTEIVAGGPARTWSYASGRLVTHSETIGTATKTTTLGYNGDGRIATETSGSATKTYGYDPAGQLIAVNRPGVLEDTTYTYDEAGNRLSESKGLTTATYTYDDAHQLVSGTSKVGPLALPLSWTFAHDGAGRLTQAHGPLAKRTIGYDPRGLPTSVTTERTGLGTWQTTKAYDGDGILRSSTTADPSNATTATAYTWDPVPAVPQIATQTTGTSEVDLLYGEERIAALRGGQADPFSYDPHGSALAAGEASDLATASSYDPYGQPNSGLLDLRLLGLTNNPAGDHKPRFGYRGELNLDGLVHLRARDYDPGAGRFTTVDPLEGAPGEPAVGNPYPYAANDALNKIDPLGLTPVKDSDLRPVYGPFDTRPRLNYWSYPNAEALVDAIILSLLNGQDPIISRSRAYEASPGSWVRADRTVSGSQYYAEWRAEQHNNVVIAARLAAQPSRGSTWRPFAELAGFIPGIGDAIDALLCGASTISGNYGDAGFDCAAIVPILGSAGRGLKYSDELVDLSTSAAQGSRLTSQLAAKEIAGGHAFDKHVLTQGEFPSIRTRAQFADMIEGVITDYDDIRYLSGDRTAYWRDGVVVIRNPSAVDGGTALVPRDGYDYFLGLG